MRPILSALILMLAAAPAFAAEDLIVSSAEPAQSNSNMADAELATFVDFTGGVGATDAKDGGSSIIIQMLQPAGQTAAAAATTARATVARSR